MCVIEALKLCLKCINSVFKNYNFQQKDGTGQRPQMFRSYCDTCIAQYDLEVFEYDLQLEYDFEYDLQLGSVFVIISL